MKQLNLSEIKSLQIKVMDDIHRFCRDNGIRYSLAFGTLIGAIRHKGYIPWDDDIDIWMPRKDYEKFNEIYGKGRYKFISEEKGVPLPYGKVYDSFTRVDEHTNHSFSKGVFVDVFPLDYLPQDKTKRESLRKKAKYILRMIRIKQIKFNKSRSVKRNLTLGFLKVLCYPFSYNYCLRKLNKLMLHNIHSENCDYYDYNAYRADFSIPINEWDNLIDVDFEGRAFKSLSIYDRILRKIYGNYMELPPVDQQKSTHSIQAFLIKN